MSESPRDRGHARLCGRRAGAAPALGSRLLEAARQERPTQSVVVLRPRRQLRLVAIAAAAAVLVAVGLGAWALSLSRSLDSERSARAASATIAAILADDGARRLSMGANGEVVRGPDGRAVLSCAASPAPPKGKTYEAWVIHGGHADPRRRLRRRQEHRPPARPDAGEGAKVAVTLEPAGGSEQPTGDILFGSGAA